MILCYFFILELKGGGWNSNEAAGCALQDGIGCIVASNKCANSLERISSHGILLYGDSRSIAGRGCCHSLFSTGNCSVDEVGFGAGFLD